MQTKHKEIDELYNKWLSVQPLKTEFQQKLDRKFMLDFNYNSNHIEGNTLTYGQTKLLFMFGETDGLATIKDYEEMKAHNVGLEMIKIEALDKERFLSENFIRELNKTILVRNFNKLNNDKTGTYEIHVREYKTRPNSVRTATNEIFEYASPEETPAFMTTLINWYREEEQKTNLSPLELAALLHYRYIRIHPFEDGNGRISRLLVNYILLRNNYPMIVIKSSDKENYLKVLHKCDIAVGLNPSDGANATIEQIKPFVDYLEIQVKNALLLGIKASKGEDIEEDDDWQKELSIIKKEKSLEDNVKIYKNDKTIINVIEKSIFTLNDEIDNLLKEFDTLLIGSNSNFFQPIKIGKSEGVIVKKNEIISHVQYMTKKNNHPQTGIEQLGNLAKIFYEKDVLLLQIEIKTLNKKTFTEKINFSFEQNYWFLETSTGIKMKKLYHQELSTEEQKDIINSYGKLIIDLIKEEQAKN
ncbi:MAG: Fic family protein [Bacteroidales bacterium]|jgi:Fic family protein|nr:Fic family protein [Bacteroidales bacterium]